jgi:hypothetical protein
MYSDILSAAETYTYLLTIRKKSFSTVMKYSKMEERKFELKKIILPNFLIEK